MRKMNNRTGKRLAFAIAQKSFDVQWMLNWEVFQQ
jgi:hypothetical protein